MKVLSSGLLQTSLGILHNFHWIEPGVAARSAQCYAGPLEPFLATRGIRSLINLRGAHPYWRWWRREVEVCRAAGIAHFDVRLCSREYPTRETLVSLFDAFDAAPRPFLIKCSGGADRTSLAAALFVLHHRGWRGLAEADRQFSRWPYLHFPAGSQEWLRSFPTFAQKDADGRPIGEWVRQGYDRREFGWWRTTLLGVDME